MNVEYEIVKYRPEFKSQILELQTHLWIPDLSVNAAYLEWKYDRNPYVDTPLIFLALRAGETVGMKGMGGRRQVANRPPASDATWSVWGQFGSHPRRYARSRLGTCQSAIVGFG